MNEQTYPLENKRLQVAINSSGYKRGFICTRLGISRTHLWDLEKKGVSPRLDLAERLAHLLSTRVSEIFPLNSDPSVESTDPLSPTNTTVQRSAANNLSLS